MIGWMSSASRLPNGQLQRPPTIVPSPISSSQRACTQAWSLECDSLEISRAFDLLTAWVLSWPEIVSSPSPRPSSSLSTSLCLPSSMRRRAPGPLPPSGGGLSVPGSVDETLSVQLKAEGNGQYKVSPTRSTAQRTASAHRARPFELARRWHGNPLPISPSGAQGTRQTARRPCNGLARPERARAQTPGHAR